MKEPPKSERELFMATYKTKKCQLDVVVKLAFLLWLYMLLIVYDLYRLAIALVDFSTTKTQMVFLVIHHAELSWCHTMNLFVSLQEPLTFPLR